MSSRRFMWMQKVHLLETCETCSFYEFQYNFYKYTSVFYRQIDFFKRTVSRQTDLKIRRQ